MKGSKGWHYAPDEKTFAYVKGRKYAPKDYESIKEKWSELYTDLDAVYDLHILVDVTDLAPYVTWGTNPSMVFGSMRNCQKSMMQMMKERFLIWD